MVKDLQDYAAQQCMICIAHQHVMPSLTQTCLLSADAGGQFLAVRAPHLLSRQRATLPHTGKLESPMACPRLRQTPKGTQKSTVCMTPSGRLRLKWSTIEVN